MAYVKIMYQNSPSTATPLNAENLNHMDDQIALNDQRLTELEGAHVSSFNGRTGAIAPESGDYNISQIAPLSGAQVGQIPVVRNDGTEEEPNLTFHMEDVPSSGHVIQNASGTDMAQEDAMQFPDSFVSDDAVNGKTIVENIKEVDPADYASTTDEGIIVCDDGEDAVIGPVSEDYVEVEADGDTFKTLFNKLRNKADLTKIRLNSQIVYGNSIFSLCSDNPSQLIFSTTVVFSTTEMISALIKPSDDCSVWDWSNGTITNISNNTVTNGTKLTLHYGNKKATVDLQTTANRCLYDDNTTVKQKIDSIYLWTKLGEKSNGESVTVDLSKYSEVLVATRVGSQPYSSFIIPVEVLISESSEHKFYGSIYQDTTFNAAFRIQYSSGNLYFYQESLNGWQSLRGIIYVK